MRSSKKTLSQENWLEDAFCLQAASPTGYRPACHPIAPVHRQRPSIRTLFGHEVEPLRGRLPKTMRTPTLILSALGADPFLVRVKLSILEKGTWEPTSLT